MEVKEIWDSSLSLIRHGITSLLGYNTYLKPARPISYSNGLMRIAVTSPLCKNMIELRYIDDIEVAVSTVVGEPSKVEIIVAVDDETLHSANGATLKDDIYKNANLNRKYTFESFVVGKSNEYATAAAQNVARNPGVLSNPLFLYGNSGMGKTHLMQAIGNKILELSPEKKVVYVSSEAFTNDMITSVRDKDMESFRQKYRDVDVLLIDDIQFIEKKQGTQEEFFHTFNDLYLKNKQIVITSDRMPKELTSIEDRLITRFEWGLSIDITAPDYETRMAILKKKAESQNVSISDDVLTYIAERVNSNIRELEGVLLRVISFARLNNSIIDMSLAERSVGLIIPEDGIIKITSDRILDKVCDFYEVSLDDILSQSRMRSIAYPRQVAMYLCKKLTNMTFVDIAKVLGNRDRTTVMYGVDKIMDDITKNQSLKEEIDIITKDLNTL